MSRPFHSSTAFIAGLSSQAASFAVPPPTVTVPIPEKTRFGYLFQQKSGDRLAESFQTVANLTALGDSMREKSAVHSQTPSVYTYFGQFIAHDLTFDSIAKEHPLHPEIKPLDPEIVNSLPNGRTGLLDLDSVYGPGVNDQGITFPVPQRGDEFELAFAYGSKVYGTDVPRGEYPPYEARIGDRRNDENLTISQLHLAFLRAHNLLVKSGLSFEEAKLLLRRRYQYLVIHDFLPRLVHADDLKEAVTKKELYSPSSDGFFIPIEFSAAAFRFGHSMIRSTYEFNQDRGIVPLRLLFTAAALGNYYQILSDWIIDWRNFVESGTNRARAFVPQLVEPLADLIDSTGNLRFSLAVNDLRRGYLLGLPTGQALATFLGITPLTEAEILDSAVSPAQKEILQVSGFAKDTPLWFYVFAEATKKRGGAFLGPVCGQMLALVLLELARRSNYEDDDPWNPILGQKDKFNLTEFLMNTLPEV
jgi:Animal haem peroxidase